MGKAEKRGAELPQRLLRGEGRRGPRAMSCMAEMQALMACMKKNAFELDRGCGAEARALSKCVAEDTAAKKKKAPNTVNHHMLRLARLMRK
jgi:hypothetical protein